MDLLGKKDGALPLMPSTTFTRVANNTPPDEELNVVTIYTQSQNAGFDFGSLVQGPTYKGV